MFEMENRGELIEKIEDLVNRKRYTELRDLLLPLEPADIAILADDLDDTVDIVEEMPANVVKRILKHSDPDMRKSINEILKYPEDSTGSIMTTEFVDLKETMTVED